MYKYLLLIKRYTGTILCSILIGIFIVWFLSFASAIVPRFGKLSPNETSLLLLSMGIVSAVVAGTLIVRRRELKKLLSELKPRYLLLLKGGPRKDLPTLRELKEELVDLINRCQNRIKKNQLLKILYNLSLLLEATEGSSKTLEQVKGELRSLGYRDESALRGFDTHLHIVNSDLREFYKLLRKCMREVAYQKMRGSALPLKIIRELEKDNISYCLGEFRREEIITKLLLGAILIICIFLLFFQRG